MREARLAILFSGNGSNLENIYRKMQNLIINPCEAPENSPASWCKKSDSKGAVVPPADFLLEADKRGSPPKSEKAAAFWEHNKKELGGAGRGVQPFLRKESSENNGEGSAESSTDSAVDCHESANVDSRNDESIQLNFVLAVSSKESAFGVTRCKNLGLKCEVVDYKKNKANFFPKIMQILQNAQIDLVILAGFMKILPPEFNANFRAINIHPSILPLFKGANAIKESYQSDMKIAGVSVHFVSDELDGGALIEQDIIHKIEGESLESFERRIHELEYEIYPKAIIKAIQIADNSGNSPLELHSADFANLWHCADFSPALRPKFTKNHESQTENPSVVDSARSAQNLRENLPIHCHSERSEESQKKNNRDSSPAAQNDNFKRSAESSLDSADSTTNAESTNKAQQTIEGIAVEVVGFLGDFGCETGLKSAKHSKSPKSPQDAPKSKLSAKSHLISKDS